MLILFAITMGMGWLVERLFWPILDQPGVARQVSETFRIFQEFSDRAFQWTDVSTDGGDGSLAALSARAKRSIRATNKALKTAAMTSSLPLSDRDDWAQAIDLQIRLLAHLVAINSLLQENRENTLLHRLDPELLALGDRLSATFTGLSVAIVSQHRGIQLPSPNIDFQRWQTRLTNMRTAGTTQSYNLASRLALGLIEHRLEGLVKDTSKILAWLETRCSALPTDLLSVRSVGRVGSVGR